MQLITRDQWGARYSNGEPDVTLPLWWEDNWLHHSVTAYLAPDATLDQEIAAIREIERIGQREFGQGISYTRIVCASGRIYEGHGLDRRGAHTYRRNDTGRAICLVGNYEMTQPTREQLLAVAAIVRDWHACGYCPRPALSGGHRDVYPTACPGRYAYAAIGEINRLASSGEPLGLDAEETPRKETDDMATFLLAPDGSHYTQDGPLVSGISSDTARATLERWGGTEIGLTEAEFTDRIAKSRLVESLPGKLDTLAGKLDELVAAIKSQGGNA